MNKYVSLALRYFFRSRVLIPSRIIFLIDGIICLLSLAMAYLLRFNFRIPAHEFQFMLTAIPVVFSIRLISFLVFRTYARLIQFTSSEDAQRIFFTIAAGTLTTGLLNFVYVEFAGVYIIPFSVLLIDFFITVFSITAYRLGVKILYNEIEQSSKQRISVIIHGANEYGVATRRALLNEPKLNYEVIAFLDNKTDLVNRKLEGVTVLDEKADLENLLHAQKPDLLIIASVNLPASRKKYVVDACLREGMKVRHIPPVSKWINGELNVSQIREINIEELLEREPIQLHLIEIGKQLRGKRVLITGAAGSIGSELARQVSRFGPEKLYLIDQAETPLYEIDLEIEEKISRNHYEAILADVRNEERMEYLFRTIRPQVVYHAAAYKHVPMIEVNAAESILTNVSGTAICAKLAAKYETDRFVLISTDKAVNPTNVMGASKRIAEMFVQSLQHHASSGRTKFVTTRFGNVLGSSGSAIPLFRKQIAAGGPLTVTHPEVTRYFMTIPEACQLVLEAGTMCNGGEIYIFDMGEPVKISDLAQKMIQLSGLKPGRDIQIVFTGLRPGEKLTEELLLQGENTMPTHHSKIMIARVREYPFEVVSKGVAELEKLFLQQNNEAIVSKMKTMVPEFISNNSIYESLDMQSAAEKVYKN